MIATKTILDSAWRLALLTLAVLTICSVAAVLASPARAALGFESFEASLSGPEASWAGAHADFTTDFVFNNHPDPVSGFPVPEADLRTFLTDLPPGLLGNPNATPRCSTLDFWSARATFDMDAGCATSTQVGVVRIQLGGYPPTELPLFNLEPAGDEVARFGFTVPLVGVAALIRPEVRTDSDYGITAVVEEIHHTIPVVSTRLTLWAEPGDPSHDPFRFSQALGDGGLFCEGSACVPPRTNPGLPPRPFLSNPTRCEGAAAVRATAIAYGFEDEPATAESSLLGSGGFTDCDFVPFDPSLSVAAGSTRPDSPSGLDVEVTLPASEDIDLPHQAHLRRAEMTLPEGVSINPAAAAGLEVCTDQQLRLGSREEAQCLRASRIGQVEVASPPLPGDGKLQGYLVQRPQAPGETFRVALIAEGHGVNVKLPGVVRPDGRTGQVQTVFEELPQLPFTSMKLRLEGGPLAPLATPARCGAATTVATLTPWSGTEPVSLRSSFEVSGCSATRTLDPEMTAGSQNPIAGDHSPFRIRITRDDGEQELARLDLKLPEGVTAKLAGVPYCPEGTIASFPAIPVAGTGAAEAASPRCPAASRIGKTTVGAGAGSSPFYTSGNLYLAGPYKGAPLSAVAIVPAVAGPFDLGVVVVRSALHVDPATTEVTVKSDPLPQIVGGVPLRMRDLRIELDRPGFSLNPTDCSQKAIGGTVTGSDGAQAQLTNRFQVADCAALGFKPKLALRFFGPTHRSAYPKLRAVLKARKGDANIGRAQVTLPETEFLANEHIRNPCTRVQYAAGNCPAGSVYGYAKAWSPLLDQPLQGPVYLRSNGGERELPDLVASMDGQIHVDLVGYIDSADERIRSTFAEVPDVPVSKFMLTMQGGKKGLLVHNTDICRETPRATARFKAQNGKRYTSHPVVKADCAKKRK